MFQIKTPKKVTIPEPSYKIPTEDESQSYLFGNTSKVNPEVSLCLIYVYSMSAVFLCCN